MLARRGFLRTTSVPLVVAVAGCNTDDPAQNTSEPAADANGTVDETTERDHDSDAAGTDPTAADGTSERSTTRSSTTGSGDAPLDLREANVTAVDLSGTDGGYRFDVTLYHDDEGEDGYANWWQVETLDGDQLGRRDLLHAHGTQPFTRSSTIEVPEGVSCVVVRGHDQTHGYGGQVALVDVQAGESVTVRQGPDPQSFDDGDCP